MTAATTVATPRDLLAARGTMALYRYRPVAVELYRVPLLLVMPPTNRGYVFDLAPGHSLVGFLVALGYDVYMLDWRRPQAGDAGAGLETYVADFVAGAVAGVRADSGEPDVTIAGYCMGGVLAALFAARFPDAGIANLVALTTPVDFAAFGAWRAATDPRVVDCDALAGRDDIVPSDWLYAAFDQLNPGGRLAGTVKLWDRRDDAEFIAAYRRLDRWSGDILPLPGALFRDTLDRLLWGNELMSGTVVAGQMTRLAAITVPFLHVVAEHDRMVPRAATVPLRGLVGSLDAAEIVVPGGHVGILAGAEAPATLWSRLDAWLGPRSV